MSNEKSNRSTCNLHGVGLVGITAISLVPKGFTTANFLCLGAEAVWIGIVEGSVVDKHIFMNIKLALRGQ